VLQRSKNIPHAYSCYNGPTAFRDMICLHEEPPLSLTTHLSRVDLKILMTKRNLSGQSSCGLDSLELVVIQQNNLCKPFHLSIPDYL
jgi:hypothetical protein